MSIGTEIHVATVVPVGTDPISVPTGDLQLLQQVISDAAFAYTHGAFHQCGGILLAALERWGIA